MQRGMISLSLTAIQRLAGWDSSVDAELGALPKELETRVQFCTNEMIQELEISEETAQSMLDILPPPHVIIESNDAVLQEISNAFRQFVLEMSAD
mgnify:CR=1 FL=1